jgi:hypothetical protein
MLLPKISAKKIQAGDQHEFNRLKQKHESMMQTSDHSDVHSPVTKVCNNYNYIDQERNDRKQ